MSPWSLPTGDDGTPWPKPDRHVPCRSNSWPKSSIARPRGRRAIGLPARSPPRAVPAEALVVYWPSAPPPDALASVESLLPVVREALASVRARHQQRRRIRRLETILEIASQWYQTREIEPLLVQMAEAATRLVEGATGPASSSGTAPTIA